MKLTSIIARRQLRDRGTGKAVIAEIGKPRKVGGRDEYYCPYRILGIGDDSVQAARGIDSVQALQTVMQAIGRRLMTIASLEHCGDSDLGFPRSGDMKFPKTLIERLERQTRKEE